MTYFQLKNSTAIYIMYGVCHWNIIYAAFWLANYMFLSGINNIYSKTYASQKRLCWLYLLHYTAKCDKFVQDIIDNFGAKQHIFASCCRCKFLPQLFSIFRNYFANIEYNAKISDTFFVCCITVV